jgi:preprotein translocase subunit YajC
MGATGSIIMIVVIIGVFILMWRSNKKQEREQNDMRNNLEVGDEITTIGGIIGEIVRIKEETVTIETGKDRTKIRILRSAIRSVDVHAAEKDGRAAAAKKAAEEAAMATPVKDDVKPEKKGLFGRKKAKKAEDVNEDVVVEAESVVNTDTTSEETK